MEGTRDPAGGLPAIRGEWEAHLTVGCPPARVAALASWAERHGHGFVHIVLARGATPSQPMVSLRGDGPLAEAGRAVAGVTARLAADGHPLTRVKIETTPWAEGVPAHDAADGTDHPGRYFEHHVKLLLAADHDRPSLERLAVAHGAHVSWNARRVRADGAEERFVTQRCAGVGSPTATRRLAALLDALAVASVPHRVVEVEREYVAHDSNLALDDGWLPAAGVRDAGRPGTATKGTTTP
ncbi:hypothetical protein SAMN06297387_12317 [Streptomyces zhaozhouensis]|uniref:Ankyrin n=1 Tax=Streptomyces zhaozhouensis TaxID=1300267 RepID=A0A286E480_9ACTN|nr:hypothetical protein [Streptomyces zhaozhouensis]SOD65706.1 hypothetical protein SAMN06297387_12317 [Streptomyces zhaozhouensis]